MFDKIVKRKSKTVFKSIIRFLKNWVLFNVFKYNIHIIKQLQYSVYYVFYNKTPKKTVS